MSGFHRRANDGVAWAQQVRMVTYFLIPLPGLTDVSCSAPRLIRSQHHPTGAVRLDQCPSNYAACSIALLVQLHCLFNETGRNCWYFSHPWPTRSSSTTLYSTLPCLDTPRRIQNQHHLTGAVRLDGCSFNCTACSISLIVHLLITLAKTAGTLII